MKKVLLILAAGVVFIALLVCLVWQPKSNPTKFSVAAPLPPGKVTPQLVSTWGTGILLAPDGSLWAWGGGQLQIQGLLGSSTVSATIPHRVSADSDWRSVDAGYTHALALKSDGSLWGWGNNGSGQLAQPGAKNPYAKPLRIGTETNWTQISAGAGHSLALKSDGSIWAWGQNEHGQVGDGTRSNQFNVTRVSQDNDCQYIAAGAFNSYALKRNGTVWGWGFDSTATRSNDSLSPKQIDPGTNWVSISASDFSLLALKSDGTLWIYGQNAVLSATRYVKQSASAFVQIGADRDWQSVYAGQGFFYARKCDGTWWISGINDRGQLAPGRALGAGLPAPRRPGINFEPWAFVTGSGNCLLLTQDGTLWTWGERIGEASRLGTWEQLKDKWNRLMTRWLKRAYPVPLPQPKIDSAPYKLWELPADMRRLRAGNTASTIQSATNAAAIEHW